MVSPRKGAADFCGAEVLNSTLEVLERLWDFPCDSPIGSYNLKGGERGLRWKQAEVTSMKMALLSWAACVEQGGTQKTKIKRVPRVKMSSTRRSTCACGKFTHHLIYGGIPGQRTQKKSSHQIHIYANIWTFQLIVQTYQGLASGVLEPAGTACKTQLHTLCLASMFSDIMLVS